MARVNTLGASAIAAAITFAVAALEPAGTGATDLWSNRKSISDDQLDAMRGGFEAANGLQLSFGIERAVFINGELVAVTRLVLSNLPNLLNGGVASAQTVANAFTIVQNGPGNSVVTDNGSTSTATAQSQPASVAASTSPVAGPTPSTSAAASATPVVASTPSTSAAASATPVGAPTSSAAASAVANRAASTGVQSVQLNGQTLLLPNATAIVTGVQNSLNNQIIQTRTSIDATMNSLSFLRSGAFADSLRQQALISARR